MTPLQKLLQPLLKRLLKQFEEQLDIFILSEKSMAPLKQEVDSKHWDQRHSLLDHYLNRTQLSNGLDRILDNQPQGKAQFFQTAIDPDRLFALEFQDQKKGKDGPIGSIVRVICQNYRVPEAEVEDWIQQICLRLSEDNFHRLRLYSGESSFLTYLITVVQRICIDEARYRWGRRDIPEKIKKMGALAEQLYALLYWEGKSVREASEQLKMEEAFDQYEEAEADNFDESLRELSNEMTTLLGTFPQPNVRHNLEVALKQGSGVSREEPEALENDEMESIAANQRTPEEAAIIREDWRHFKEQLYHANCLHVYVLTQSAMEALHSKMGQTNLPQKLDSMLYQEFERKSEFLQELKRNSGSLDTRSCEPVIVEQAFRVSPQYLLVLKRVEEGISLPAIAQELEMPLNVLYLRINRLKTEMTARGWDKNLVDQFFKR